MVGLFQQILKASLILALLTTFNSTVIVSEVIAAPCGTAPTVSLDESAKDVLPDDSVDYTVTITNNDAGSCDFDLSTSGDSAGFTSLLPSGTPFTIAGGATDTTILRVSVSGQPIGTVNTTTLAVDVVNTVATTSVNNSLLHNSFNLSSTKWAGSGGWGLTSTKYGEFSCGTCHAKNTGNIKRVNASVSFPDNSDMPAGVGVKSTPVNFQAITGNNSFGDDDPLNDGTTGHATSTRVCEVCHSTTNHHNYDTSNNGAPGLSHYNNTDCTQCHKHNEGFKASGCNGCHGDTGVGNFWPDNPSENPADYPDRVGMHVEHVNAIGDAINGGGAGSATMTDKNNTCVYCHPNPGGSNVDGASHDTDTITSPVSTPDLHKDGWNPTTSFTNLQAGVDSTGYYTPAIVRCSTVDCHSNGEFTWTWYSDVLAPGQITDLAAVTGTDVGTVDLTWTAPANDGNDGPNAYHYEVRYLAGTGGITDANWATATIAGGPPSVGRRGKGTSMTVILPNPGATYSFAVKTADEVDNWAVASNSPSALAKSDTEAPIFWGLGSATSTDETGSVLLSWEAARDHSLPITYTVYYDTGVIDYGGDDTVVTTTGTTLKVDGLPSGIVHNFAVRATDAAANTDTNTVVKQVLPRTASTLLPTITTYYTNGTTGLQTGTYGTPGTNGNTTFRAPAYTADTIVLGTSFYANFNNGNENLGGTVTADFGYWQGGAFNHFTPNVTTTKTIAPNTQNKIYRLGFGGGGVVPSGAQVAVRINVNNPASISYGSTANRGDIAVQETLYNHLPPAAVFSPQPSGSGTVTISWNGVATDQDGHAVHYDVVGSDDNGLTYKHIIAEGVVGAATNSVNWDTIADGIGLDVANTGVKVKILAMDGYQSGDGSGNSVTATESTTWTVNNTQDSIPPGQILDLLAETRPKTGALYLTWTAPGDDNYDETRASYYDIRYSTADITSEALFSAATELTSEPVPDFGGRVQGYEVVDLVPDTTYYFAIKACDEGEDGTPGNADDNCSPVSNSSSADGGKKCGICHGTPPDDATTAGNHLDHGYTVPDCIKCHGEEVAGYGIRDYNLGIRHQDGLLQLGFGRDAAGVKLPEVTGVFTGDTITYTQNGFKIYEDTSSGGFTASPGGDQIDNGTCFNFSNVNATGCHGPATPPWDENANLPCAACHGDNARTTDPYGQPYDSSSVRVKASPPVDNRGDTTGKFVGQHEKHLNYSFRYSKGDSCNMCHKNNSHADGMVDITYDFDAAGATALFTPNATGPDTPGTCGGTSGMTCHGSTATPEWDSTANVNCVSCHEFGGTTPDHVTDPAGGVTLADNGWATDPMPGNCTYCHPAGHPSGVPANTLLIPNNNFVGINYSGGGIHLRTNIGARGPYTSEAETCWGCHDSNGISEWGANSQVNTGNSPYNYGSLSTSNWTTATWTSANFAYKTGAIQSTHTTSPAGSSAVTFNGAVTPKRYEESPDAVTNIRCTNCHDVHNRNLAIGDTSTGTPYLRGTWMGNPYEEDGAPQAGTNYYANHTVNMSGHSYAAPTIGLGAVPRGGIRYNELGGFYIDENNVVPGTGGNATPTPSTNPTASWTLQSSAGLCTLCHGSDVDALDQETGENLWVGSNGHSNAVLGGSGTHAVNIFDYTHGRPVPNAIAELETENYNDRIPDMGNQRGGSVVGDQYYVYGYRASGGVGASPKTYNNGEEHLDVLAYDWAATVDASTTDIWYHQFSCSKCHNPHASRLPKLMITNCLDVRHNTWDDNKGTQNVSSASTTDSGKHAAYWNSAQNCHRRDSARNTTTFGALENGGWNLVTPW